MYCMYIQGVGLFAGIYGTCMYMYMYVYYMYVHVDVL